MVHVGVEVSRVYAGPVSSGVEMKTLPVNGVDMKSSQVKSSHENFDLT